MNVNNLKQLILSKQKI